MVLLDYTKEVFMAIPKEILDVERPINTVVHAYGKDNDKYGVRMRIGCKYENGKRKPITGPTIGHIIDGRYVPKSDNEIANVSSSPIELKVWGSVVHCDSLFKDIMKELLAVYSKSDAEKIYCISILRVCFPGVKDGELLSKYEESFLSEIYPDVALSKNTVSKLFKDLGNTPSRIVDFMRNRTATIPIDHHLLIDGTLKSNESKVNTLSNFSRKAKTKGSRDISVLFAFDLEEMEPICSKCFPGNMLDRTAYEEFLTENNITSGLVVADKGFPEAAARQHFANNPHLHYLNPIMRNSKLIKKHNMLEFTGLLSDYEGITYRKEKCIGADKWLYSFRNIQKASQEEKNWLSQAKTNNTYNLETLKKKQESFGTIVFECDLDLPVEEVYKAYEKRWEIELVMKYYKSACEFDETRVHEDSSVIGSEFCDFLSTVLTYRLINSFDEANLLEKKTYKALLKALRAAKKVKLDGEWKMIKINPSNIKVLQEIGLLPKPELPQKNKLGRPAKTSAIEKPTEIIKRKPGRPPGSKNKPKTDHQ